MADPTLKIKIQADGAGAAAGEIKKVQGATDDLGGASKKLASEQGNLGASTRAVSSEYRSATAAAQDLSGATGAVGAAMAGMASALTVTALIGFSRAMVTAKDEMAAMRQQALMISGSTKGFDDLYASAQRLGMGIMDMSQAVNFFAPALAKLGKSYEQSIEFTENLTKSMQVYGLQGQAAASVTLQLSQALSSGTLGGDELKSLRENAGGLAMKLEEAIQKILDTKESIKTLGTQNRLTSEVVSAAWDVVFKQLQGQFDSLPDTLAKQDARMANAGKLLMEALDSQLHQSAIWQWMESGATTAMEKWATALKPPSLGSYLDRVVQINAEIERLNAALKVNQESWIQTDTVKARTAAIANEINELEKKRATYIELQATDSEVLSGYEERQLNNRREQNKADADAAGIQKAWADASVTRLQVETAFGQQAAATIEKMLPTITAMAQKYNVSEAAIIAMMKAESNFNQQALSGKGAVGVMQMTGVAAEQVAAKTGLSLAQMRDSWQANIEGGAAYMRWLLDNSNGAIKNMDDLARAYNAGLGGMNKGYDETVAHGDKVSAAFAKMAASGLTWDQALAKNTETFKQYNAEMDKAATAEEKYAIHEAQINAIPIEAEDKVQAYLANQREQLRVAGLTTDEKIRSAEATKLETWALADEKKARDAANKGDLAAADSYEVAAERIRALKKEAGDNEVATYKMLAAHKAAAPTIAELWTTTVTEMSKGIQTSLTDAFTGLFSGTINTASKFIDALKQVVIKGLANLASAILMNPINVVINATLVGASGSAQAGQTTVQSAYQQGGGGASGLLSAGQYLTGGSSIGTSLAGYMVRAAASLDMASKGFLTYTSSLATTSNLMLGAGSVLGALAGSFLFNGKGYSQIGSSIGSTAGTIIGAAIAGPIGALVGGLLGGAGGGFLGSLFGGKEKAPTPETLYIQQAGGYFTTTGAINSNHETLQKVQEAEQAINDLTGALADILGPEAAAVRNTRGTVNQSLTPENIGEWLKNEASYTVGEMIAATTGNMREIIWTAWESSGHDLDKVLAVAQEAKALLDNLPAIEKSLTDAGVNLGDNADKATINLLAMAGGMDALIASQSAYAKLFIGPEEAAKNQGDALAEEFRKLDVVLPATRAELRALVDGFDMTNEYQVKARLGILGMADALDEYYKSMENGIETTSGFIFIFDKFLASLKDTATSMAQAKNAYNTLFVTPQDEMDRIKGELEKAFKAFGFTLPDTRAALKDLVDSFDLTTASGRLAYLGVMSLSAELDALYKSLDDAKKAVDSYLALQKQYNDLFTPESEKSLNEFKWLTDAFGKLGYSIPPTREAFRKFIDSLSEEERRLLGLNDDILGKLDKYYKEKEASAQKALDDELKALESAAEAKKKALQDSMALEKEALQASHQARLDALQAEATAAQEALSKIQAVASALKTAIDGFKLEKDTLDQTTFKAAQAQLVAWAAGSGLPEQAALDKTLGGIGSFSKSSYATQADYARDYWVTMNALNTLDKRAGVQQTAAEKMVEGIQKQIDLENKWYEAEMKRLDDILAAQLLAIDVALKAAEDAAKRAEEIYKTIGDSDPNRDRSKDVPADPMSQPTNQPVDSSGGGKADVLIQSLIDEVKAWREAQRLQVVDMASYQKRSADTLRKWDDEGLPDNRDGVALLRVG